LRKSTRPFASQNHILTRSSFYNETSYSGLENHISNSYANSLLQVLHYTPLVRNLALQHAATGCINDKCLLCEMGFVFDMLDKAEGSICHATNLLKTLSNHPQAGPLGLLEEDAPGASLTNMLQGLNRFLLDKIAQDYRSIPPHSAAFDQVSLFSILELLSNSLRFWPPPQPWLFDA